jgi:hypothetical protein
MRVNFCKCAISADKEDLPMTMLACQLSSQLFMNRNGGHPWGGSTLQRQTAQPLGWHCHLLRSGNQFNKLLPSSIVEP